MKMLQTEAAINKIFTPLGQRCFRQIACGGFPMAIGDWWWHYYLLLPCPPPSAQLIAGQYLPAANGQGEASPSQSQGLKRAKLMLHGAAKSQQAQLSFRVHRSMPAGCFKQQDSANPREILPAAARGAMPSNDASLGQQLSSHCWNAMVAPGACRGWCWGVHRYHLPAGWVCNYPKTQVPKPSQSLNIFSASCFAGLWVNPARLDNSQHR